MRLINSPPNLRLHLRKLIPRAPQPRFSAPPQSRLGVRVCIHTRIRTVRVVQRQSRRPRGRRCINRSVRGSRRIWILRLLWQRLDLCWGWRVAVAGWVAVARAWLVAVRASGSRRWSRIRVYIAGGVCGNLCRNTGRSLGVGRRRCYGCGVCRRRRCWFWV